VPPGAKFSKMSKIHVLHLRYNLYFFSKFCRNTWFFPIIDDALSVAILTARGQSTPTLLSRISFAVVVSIIKHQHQELLSDRQSLINATNEYGLENCVGKLCILRQRFSVSIYTFWETRLSNLWKTKSPNPSMEEFYI